MDDAVNRARKEQERMKLEERSFLGKMERFISGSGQTVPEKPAKQKSFRQGFQGQAGYTGPITSADCPDPEYKVRFGEYSG